MKFTWGEEKNRRNRRKHGIDFADVPRVFDGPLVTFLDRKKEYGEDRWVGIGWLSDVLTVIVFKEPAEQTTLKANRHEQGIYRDEIRD